MPQTTIPNSNRTAINLFSRKKRMVLSSIELAINYLTSEMNRNTEYA